MPRTPDMPCANCGRLMYRGTTSLPEGKAMCLPCRRRGVYRRAREPWQPEIMLVCRICNTLFVQHRHGQVYCSIACRNGKYVGKPRKWAAKKATTTERGYGRAHQLRRRELLPAAYGTDCPLCGEVMTEGQSLDLDHSLALALGGSEGDRITHARCNRAQGSRVSRMRRDLQRQVSPVAALYGRQEDGSWSVVMIARNGVLMPVAPAMSASGF